MSELSERDFRQWESEVAGKRSSAFYNLESSDDAKAAFAYRLSHAMAERGWNQSEMARRASGHLPKPAKGQKQGHAIGRDLISNYVRGTVLPRPTILTALAKALGCAETDLMAPRSVPSAAIRPESSFTLQERKDGMALLEIRRVVSMKKAMQIIGILNSTEE